MSRIEHFHSLERIYYPPYLYLHMVKDNHHLIRIKNLLFKFHAQITDVVAQIRTVEKLDS